jgi:hypothetical protein
VFRHLQRHGQVEGPVGGERPGEVVGAESLAGDVEAVPIDVVAVHAANVPDAVLAEHGQPRPQAAPDVDHAPGRDQPQDERDDDPGGPSGPVAVGGEEVARVRLGHDSRPPGRAAPTTRAGFPATMA